MCFVLLLIVGILYMESLVSVVVCHYVIVLAGKTETAWLSKHFKLAALAYLSISNSVETNNVHDRKKRSVKK